MIDTVGIALGGLVLGAAGSGHCAVMCGPLVALSNPRRDDGRADGTRRLVVHSILYHGGRVAMYVTLGAAIGVTGSALSSAGLGRVLAFAAAGALLVQAAATWLAVRSDRRGRVSGLVTRAIGRTGTWMRRHRISGAAAFGALTGLLPCGLVYAALTAAAGMGAVADSAVFMLAFGLGTVPLLATVGVSANHIGALVPAPLKRAAPFALAAIAVLLIIRASGTGMAHAGHTPAGPAGIAHHHAN